MSDKNRRAVGLSTTGRAGPAACLGALGAVWFGALISDWAVARHAAIFKGFTDALPLPTHLLVAFAQLWGFHALGLLVSLVGLVVWWRWSRVRAQLPSVMLAVALVLALATLFALTLPLEPPCVDIGGAQSGCGVAEDR